MYTPAREPACAFEHVLGCTCASACECRPVWYAAQRYSHTQAHVHVRGRSGRAPSLATRKHSTSRFITPRPHELSHGPHSVARQRNCSPHEPAWHGCDTRSMSRCCVGRRTAALQACHGDVLTKVERRVGAGGPAARAADRAHRAQCSAPPFRRQSHTLWCGSAAHRRIARPCRRVHEGIGCVLRA